MTDHEILYADLRRAVNRLYFRLEHPYKKQALGYVLNLFGMQDADPYCLHGDSTAAETAKQNSVETRKKAWEKRRQKKVENGD